VRVFSRRGHDWTDRVPPIAGRPVEGPVTDRRFKRCSWWEGGSREIRVTTPCNCCVSEICQACAGINYTTSRASALMFRNNAAMLRRREMASAL
jgi:hypothetical protein